MGAITDLIYQSILEKKQNETERGYLGFSEIGNPCLRYLWIKYHYPQLKEPMSEKQAAIFENGHWVERKLIQQMRDSGIIITGQQKEASYFDGQFKGHIEGFFENHPEYGKIPFEIKGLNQTSFKELVKKEAKAKFYNYYVQAQINMYSHEFDKLVFIAENKNNQDLYEEVVLLDTDCVQETLNKAERVLFGPIPQMLSSRRDWWQCCSCQFNHDEACRKRWRGESPF